METKRGLRLIKWIYPRDLADGTQDWTVALQYLIDTFGVESLSQLRPGIYSITQPLRVGKSSDVQ